MGIMSPHFSQKTREMGQPPLYRQARLLPREWKDEALVYLGGDFRDCVCLSGGRCAIGARHEAGGRRSCPLASFWGVDGGGAHPEQSEFCVGRGGDGGRVLQPAVCLVLG